MTLRLIPTLIATALAALALPALASGDIIPSAVSAPGAPMIQKTPAPHPKMISIDIKGVDGYGKTFASGTLSAIDGRAVTMASETRQTYIASVSRKMDDASTGVHTTITPGTIATGVSIVVLPTMVDPTHVKLRVEARWSGLDSLATFTAPLTALNSDAAAPATVGMGGSAAPATIEQAIAAMPESYGDHMPQLALADQDESSEIPSDNTSATIQLPTVRSMITTEVVVAKIGEKVRIKLGKSVGNDKAPESWVELTAREIK